MLEKTLESPLDCKEVQPVHPKGNPPWIFIGRTDVEAETPIFWSPNMKSWLIWKDPDEGKDWRCEEKGTTEDEMVGWNHQLDGHEFEQAPGVGDGQGSLACWGSWGLKSQTWLSDWKELNWIESYISIITLNVNGLNAQTKRQTCGAGRNMHFHFPHHSAWPSRLYAIILHC